MQALRADRTRAKWGEGYKMLGLFAAGVRNPAGAGGSVGKGGTEGRDVTQRAVPRPPVHI